MCGVPLPGRVASCGQVDGTHSCVLLANILKRLLPVEQVELQQRHILGSEAKVAQEVTVRRASVLRTLGPVIDVAAGARRIKDGLYRLGELAHISCRFEYQLVVVLAIVPHLVLRLRLLRCHPISQGHDTREALRPIGTWPLVMVQIAPRRVTGVWRAAGNAPVRYTLRIASTREAANVHRVATEEIVVRG